jgi:hypothetical protein
MLDLQIKKTFFGACNKRTDLVSKNVKRVHNIPVLGRPFEKESRTTLMPKTW